MRQTFLDGGKLVMLLKKFLAKSRETLSHIMSKILAFPLVMPPISANRNRIGGSSKILNVIICD